VRDYPHVAALIEKNSPPYYTGWKLIRPTLESVVQAARTKRLAKQRAALVGQRKVIVELLYKTYLKTLKPSQWFFQPSSVEVCEFSPFNEIVEAPDGVTVDAASFGEAMERLPGLIAIWTEGRRRTLMDLLLESLKDMVGGTSLPKPLPETHTNGHGEKEKGRETKMGQEDGEVTEDKGEKEAIIRPNPSASTIPSPSNTIDTLNLATSVFECGRGCLDNRSPWGYLFSNPLIAWEGVNTHQCKERDISTLIYDQTQVVASVYKFSVRGSTCAASLISLAGLDVARTTPADMDDRDLLFFCQSCGPQKDIYEALTWVVFTWRSAVCLVVSARFH
jgi:hypothetical protein